MAQASRDQNSVPTILGANSTTGATTVKITADPSTHALSIDDNTTGSDHGPTYAIRDQNHVPVLMAVSSADGVTPIILYADADGNLLIDSN